MSIRRKSLFIVIGTLIFTIAVLYLTTYLILTRSFQRIENDMAKVGVERVLLTLDSRVDYIKNTSADWGYWDETYLFVQGLDPEFIENNVTISTFNFP